MAQRQIIHIRADNLTAVAELTAQPQYAGVLLAVLGGGAAPVVRGLSPEARGMGLREDMPAWEARQRFPEAVFVTANRAHALPLAKQVLDQCAKYTPQLEAVALDEFCLDVTGSMRLFGSAARVATRLIDEVERTLGLDLRVGIGPSRLIARIASGQAPVRRYVEIGEDLLPGALQPLSVGDLGMLSEEGVRWLRQAGVRTVGELAEVPLALLERRFGALGPQLAEAARGVDLSPVPVHAESLAVAQVSTEVRLLRASRDREKIDLHVRAAADGLAARLQREGCVGRSLTLVLHCADGTDFRRSCVLPGFASASDAFYRPAAQMAAAVDPGARMIKSVRLLAADLRTQALPEQLSLLEEAEAPRPRPHPRQQRAQRALLDLPVHRGSLLGKA